MKALPQIKTKRVYFKQKTILNTRGMLVKQKMNYVN